MSGWLLVVVVGGALEEFLPPPGPGGMACHRVAGAAAALASLRQLAPPGVVLLAGGGDLGPAITLCRDIRRDARFGPYPVVVTGAPASRIDVYEAFLAGASDVVPADAGSRELALRVQGLLARAARRRPARTLRLGSLTVDLQAQAVRAGERWADTLTPRETAILTYLLGRCGRPSTTEEILVEALGYPARHGNPEVVRTHVRHIRQKLEADPSRPQYLLNVPRVGYRLDVPEAV